MLEQVTWLAINIYNEARGEGKAGQIGVGHVTMNRLQKEKKSIRDVVLKPYQFSWANGGEQSWPAISDYGAFVACMDSAMECLLARLNGETMEDVDHYYSTDIPAPYWEAKMKFVVQIGKHRFYNSQA